MIFYEVMRHSLWNLRSQTSLCRRCGRVLSIKAWNMYSTGSDASQGPASFRTHAAHKQGQAHQNSTSDVRDTGVKLYNKVSHALEPLLLTGPILKWYSCGPTVYDSTHIGHASSYVRLDIIRRILTSFFHVDLVMAMGVTDIDDKIINKANQMQLSTKAVSRLYETQFFTDMTSLNVLPPHVRTRVTDHLPGILSFIDGIMGRGMAYVTPSGSVYFDVLKDAGYGRLRRASDPSYQGEHTDPEKHSPRDFALWKAAKAGEPWWESAWGPGRPGWHIECPAMIRHVFGDTLDIHTGGEDLIFPHHENELAEACAFYNTDSWVKHWIHTGHLYRKGDSDKMSKSLKNYVSVEELLQQHTANQFRMLCLLAPYSNIIEYSESGMEKASILVRQLQSFLTTCDAYLEGKLACKTFSETELWNSLLQNKKSVYEALAEDINTPRAVELSMRLVSQVNTLLNSTIRQGDVGCRELTVIAVIKDYIQTIYSKLGLTFDAGHQSSISSTSVERCLHDVTSAAVELRSRVRQFVFHPTDQTTTDMSKDERKSRQKDLSPLLSACDELRDRLAVNNVEVKDHGSESSWKQLDEHLPCSLETDDESSDTKDN